MGEKVEFPRFHDAQDVFALFAAPQESQISRISIEPEDSISFTDSDARPNYFQRRNLGLVKQYEVHLAYVQSDGYIKVTFNPFTVCAK